MPSRTERRALRLVARGFVTLLVILVAIPGYLSLAPAWRPLAVRLACALLLAAGCSRVLRQARRSMEDRSAWALDAPLPAAPPPELDERFLRLRDELRFSSRRRQYFDTVLWPRLCRLGSVHRPQPVGRRGLRGDGPSLSTLERLVGSLETRA